MDSSRADAFAAFETAGWNRQAAGYHRMSGGVTSRVVDPLLDAVAAGPGVRLLEFRVGAAQASPFDGASFDAGVAPLSDPPSGPPFFHFSDDANFRALLQGAGLVDVGWCACPSTTNSPRRTNSGRAHGRHRTHVRAGYGATARRTATGARSVRPTGRPVRRRVRAPTSGLGEAGGRDEAAVSVLVVGRVRPEATPGRVMPGSDT